MALGRKTGGRVAGVPNKATTEFRQTVQQLLEDNRGKVQVWLSMVAEGDDKRPPDPGKALDLLAKLAEFAAPKLGRIEHVGDRGEPIKVTLQGTDASL